MTYMGYEFRAPKKDDVRAWTRIADGVRKGSAWEDPTIRKQRPAPKISPALKAALGIQKKRPSKTPESDRASSPRI
jgi:hypothetical protein